MSGVLTFDDGLSVEVATETLTSVITAPEVVGYIITDAIPGPPGPRGLVGAPGPPGPEGPPVTPLMYTQDLPATTWVIPHSFTYFPAVTVVDSQGETVDVEIRYTLGVVTVYAEYAFAGRAHLI